MLKAIIFDFDGVILDSFEFHRSAIKEFTGTYLSDEEFRAIHDGNFFEGKSDIVNNTNWKDYRDFVYDNQSKLKIEDNVKETLLELNKNYDLFIISSGGERNIKGCLTSNGLINTFKEVLGLESDNSKLDKFHFIFDKYNIKSDECIFITDTLGDILEANKAKVKTIAVEFGYHQKERLEKGKPSMFISNFKEIEPIMNNLSK